MPASARAPRRGASQRQVQVGEAIRQAVSEVLVDGSLKDPRIGSAMVTVTEVVMTPDLKLARVFVSVYPEGEERLSAVLSGLRSALPEIKREVGVRLSLRFTPAIEFKIDPSVATGARMETLLRELNTTADEG